MNNFRVPNVSLISKREGEIKLGERIDFYNLGNLSSWLNSTTASFILVGLPEDIGIRANLGRPGAKHMWDVFISKFLNIQSNSFLSGDSIACLGAVDFTHILPNNSDDLVSDYKELRHLTSKIDACVVEILSEIYAANKIPIVIGGGHNNAYACLKAYHQIHNTALNCINIDPHADLRPLEGRHSGNGFSYALNEHFLTKYFVIGLHENYNSQFIIDQFNSNKHLSYSSFDQFLQTSPPITNLVNEAINFIGSDFPFGMEFDLDAIIHFPTSAETSSGFTLDQARQFCQKLASYAPKYLHLCEGAPTVNGNENLLSGKSLSYLVSDFIKHYKTQ